MKVVVLYDYVVMTLQLRYDSYPSLRKSQNTRRVTILFKSKVIKYKYARYHFKATFNSILMVVFTF